MCQTGADRAATITGGATGTFSAAPTGLVFLNTSNGLIDMSASTTGSYNITYTTTGPNSCHVSRTVPIVITNAPNATFSYAGPYCSNGIDPSPTFGLGASGGIFSSFPAGLVFISTATGQVDLSASTPGTYTVTNSIAAGGGCGAASGTNTITINAAVTPNFNPIPAICSGGTFTLPGTSTNGVTGTWLPAVNNTSTTTYYFTPTAGQCANSATLTVVVNLNITPTFSPIPDICSGGALTLPPTSLDPFTGTWMPVVNNTASTTYTFTPTAGLCATTTTKQVIVNPTPPIYPSSTLASICVGGTSSLLANSNINGTTYVWNPGGFNGTPVTVTPAVTTTYTVTGTAPMTGCTGSATLTVTVNNPDTPTFNPVAAVCSGSSIAALPITSLNGYTGTWSPALNNRSTTTYTFTPTIGQCAATTTLTITVTPTITPTFSYVGAICSGDALAPLPTTSINGYTGSWLPALNNAATTTYVFTPTGGQCVNFAILTIPVYTGLITTSYASSSTICNGASASLSASSDLCRATYLWSPGGLMGASVSVSPTTTTTYTVSGTEGGCTGSSTVTVTVNTPVTTTFNPVAAVCSGDIIAPLPTSSTNIPAIYGIWAPALNNTATTTYTFTPAAVLCATTANMSIVVNAPAVPAFNNLGPYTEGSAPDLLPLTSVNGITGTWTPATISTAVAGITVYTFTPTTGQCATTNTMSITINPLGWFTTQGIGTTLFLSWTPVPNASTYAIYWKLNTSQNWIANSVNKPYVKATNLIPGQLYDCRYIAYRSNGTYLTESGLPTTVPNGQFTTVVPTFVKKYDIGTTCEIDWDDWSNWASSYVLQYRVAGSSNSWINLPANINFCKMPNLTAGLPGYECKVVVYRNGSYWGTTDATLSSTFQTTDVMFTLASQNAAHTGCQITWPSQAPWATGHHFYYKRTSDPLTAWIGSSCGVNDYINLSGLTPGVPYDCKLQVYKNAALNYWGETVIGHFTLGGPKEVALNGEDNGIYIYPNPFKDQVNIDILAQDETKVVWNIYDMTGKKVLMGIEKLSCGFNTFTVDVSCLSSGIYCVKISRNSGVATKKIVKE